MPNTVFKPSLIDPATNQPDLLLSGDCLSINTTDHSNYAATNEVGYTPLARFANYRKIIVTHQSGKTFIMSSLPGGDQLIPAAATGTQVMTYTIGYGDGVYSFQLLTLPTWNAGDTYINLAANQIGPQIVYNAADGLLYKNLLAYTVPNLNNQPDLSPTDWAVISEADAFLSRFSTTEKISIYCDANVCYDNNVAAANCGISSEKCDDEMLWRNKNFMNSMKLRCLIDGIAAASQKGRFDLAEKYFDDITTICSCS